VQNLHQAFNKTTKSTVSLQNFRIVIVMCLATLDFRLLLLGYMMSSNGNMSGMATGCKYHSANGGLHARFTITLVSAISCFNN